MRRRRLDAVLLEEAGDGNQFIPQTRQRPLVEVGEGHLKDDAVAWRHERDVSKTVVTLQATKTTTMIHCMVY